MTPHIQLVNVKGEILAKLVPTDEHMAKLRAKPLLPIIYGLEIFTRAGNGDDWLIYQLCDDAVDMTNAPALAEEPATEETVTDAPAAATPSDDASIPDGTT